MKLSEINGTGENYIYGWLFFDGQLQSHTCLIHEKGTTLTLMIPFNKKEKDILNWFDLDEYSYSGMNLNKNKLPDHFWIQDVFESKQYSVFDYAVRGQKINRGSGIGSIRLELTGIVCNTSFNFVEMTKVITSSPEYLYWTGLRCLSMETGYNSVSGLPESFEVELTNKEKVQFEIGEVELSLIPSWNTFSAGEDKKTIAVTDNVLFESSVETKTNYDSLIVFHERFRNLLSILAWRKIGYREIKLFNKEDTVNYINGEIGAAPSRLLITSRHDRWEPTAKPDSFLFCLDDIGIQGLKLWFLMCENYQRALMTLSYVARNSSMLAVETQIIELSISIEEIAKPLSCELGTKEPRKFEEKVRLVVSNFLPEYLELLPSEYEVMLQDISSTYNSLKHTKEKRNEKNREEWLDHNNLLHCMFACRLILLVWISFKLGCSAEKLKSAINNDFKLSAVRKWWN